MDTIISNFDFTNIAQMSVWLILAYGVVLLAMAIDLVSGIKKAIQNHVARTSRGLKMTCDKANKYYSPMLRLTFVDILASAFISIPPLTLLWASWCLFCEWKSVTEKAHTKKELREAAETMSVVLKNKDDITDSLAQAIADALQKMSEDKK